MGFSNQSLCPNHSKTTMFKHINIKRNVFALIVAGLSVIFYPHCSNNHLFQSLKIGVIIKAKLWSIKPCLCQSKKSLAMAV